MFPGSFIIMTKLLQKPQNLRHIYTSYICLLCLLSIYFILYVYYEYIFYMYIIYIFLYVYIYIKRERERGEVIDMEREEVTVHTLYFNYYYIRFLSRRY